jgi:hypothetical protein
VETSENITSRTVVLGFAGAVHRLGAATCHIGGSLGFEVTGRNGGCWVIDLTVPGGKITETAKADAGTVVKATDDAMVSFFLTPERIPELKAQGQLAIAGDIKRLQSIASALRGTRSWLDR